MQKKALLLLVALLFTAACATTSTTPIFELTDPRGDDHGDGSLAYPLSREIAPGDLDLLSLAAYPTTGGTMFEATFARPIKVPTDTTIDAGGTSLLDVAKYGFYTFNIDIYVDQDLQPGSGSVSALPGRNAELQPEHAWERVVALTPRPEETRVVLRSMMARDAAREARKAETVTPDSIVAAKRAVSTDVDLYVHFPTKVQVQGSAVRFFVPASFFGGKVADPNWSYTVVVTGADLAPRVDLAGMLRPASETLQNLMVLPIVTGRSDRNFGGRRDDDLGQTPIVDLIVPAGGPTQEEILKDYDPRGGRPVRLPGIVPGS